MAYISPELNNLRGMLEMIVGPSAGAKGADNSDGLEISHTAVYIDKDDTPVASCSCDMKTAAALGCSLSMIPPAGAEGMIDDGELSANANDNLYEVMNMFSSLLMNDKSSHLKLAKVDPGSDSAVAGETVKEVCFSLELGAYGSGTIVFNAA